MAGKRGGSNEDALSEIIGFVLILALVVAGSTLYLLYVVPAEGREDEIEHMNQVQERFVSYKTSVDGLWMRSLADLSVPGTRGVSLSTSFDLGTGGGNTQSTGLFLSFMRPIGTAARMRVDSDEGDLISISVNNVPIYINPDHASPTDPEHFYVPIGSLRYDTDNYYWIQQSYIYEMGGVFLEQANEGVSVKVAPALSLFTDQHLAKVTLCLVNLTNEDRTIGGTGPLRVETRLRESMDSVPKSLLGGETRFDNVTVRIKARDEHWAGAWRQVFLDAATRGGLGQSGMEDWFEVSSPPYTDNTVELKVYHKIGGGNPSATPDVLFSLYETTFQVTFEYDEP